MATTRDELIGFVDELYVPKIASGGLRSMIRTGQEAMKASILLFAAGEGGEQPDLVAWLDEQDLLSDDGLDEPPGESVMAESYGSRQDEVNTKKDEMNRQSRAVNDAAFKTFSVTNETYVSIKERVGGLDNDLRGINERKDENGADLPLTVGEEVRALRFVVQAVDDVHDSVEAVYAQIQTHAGGIDDSRPSFASAPRGNGSTQTLSTPWTASNASFDPTGTGTVDDILSRARHELGLGVREGNGNNVAGIYDKYGRLVDKRPYNINDAWCASFASWVWEKSGYKVDWTNKNYVPSIWSDAKKMKLNQPPSNAQPGMIIFDWEGDGKPDHIGLVESVNGNTITTIEGNSSNAVARNQYQMGNSDVVGVVKTPAQKQNLEV